MFALATLMAFGQVNTATILGTVTDASGAAAPGATVTVTHMATQASQTAQTDDSGSYSLERLPIGEYTLTAKAAGFKVSERKNIRLDATNRVKIDVTLEVGGVTESVTVEGGAPLVSTQNTEMGIVIGEEQVRNLPLNGRNFSQLIALEPGAVVSGGAVYFNGLTRDGVNITIDGTDASNPDRPATSGFGGQTQQNALSVEFIQEFKTTKGVFSAELGRAASGGVNVITKAGTNDFHGSVYEFIRNDSMDARNFFAARKDKLRLNQFGATAGGPVIRNKAFFFLGWEGVRERRGRQISGEVPTDSLRQRMLAANPLYGPLLALLPPSTEDRGNPDRGFHRRSDVRTNTENAAMARLDFHPTSKDNLFVRYNILDSYTVVPSLSPVNGTEYPAQDRSGTLSWNRILTPSTMNELRVGVNKQDIPRATQAFIPQQIGNLTGFISTPNQELLRANGGSWTLIDNFARNAGRHSLKIGMELRSFHYGRANHEAPAYEMPTLADLLASRFTNAYITIGNNLRRLREKQWGIYVQDDFRVNARLTLNLGVRYEYFTPVKERDGLLFNVVDSPYGAFRQQGQPIWEPDRNNFGPRFGMAWDMGGNSKNVIRGGGGVFYSPNTYREVTAFVNPPTAPYSVQLSSVDFPNLRYPVDIRTIDLSKFPGGTSRNVFDPFQRTTYSMQWTLDYQREVTKDLVATFGYVGNHALKLLTLHWLNDIDIATGRRPVTSIARISYQEHSGMSNYHALQTTLKKRFSSGVTFNVHYTYGKGIQQGGVDNMTAATVQGVQDHANVRASRSRFVSDINHNFVADYSWDVPFDRWLHADSGAARKVAGGWQVYGIASLRSGTPLLVLSGRDNYGTGTTQGQRPDLVAGVPVFADNYRTTNNHQYISRAAFADPCDARAARRPCGIYGNFGAFTPSGPGSFSFDFSTFKNIAINERMRFQFRAELFNLFNRPNFSNPGVTLTSSTFGQITGAGNAREVQFALKFLF
ncbi:MAG: carboxypeptidase regulatory-like domain-containing protein [Bryobacteraceae bacterium]